MLRVPPTIVAVAAVMQLQVPPAIVEQSPPLILFLKPPPIIEQQASSIIQLERPPTIAESLTLLEPDIKFS